MLWKIAGASLALLCAGAPRDLAPEVLLLARIKSHLHEELSHVPNSTCLETVSRFRRDSRSNLRSRGKLTALDTVRLEIVYSGTREWYGSPGARNLSEESPAAFTGSGMIGNGEFALTLNNILVAAIFTYRGEETIGGRTAVRYDFRLPRMLKPLTISMLGGSGTVGEEGSLWADPQSLDLIRLESHAVEIPPYLPLQEASSSVYYARMRIGADNVLMAQKADSRMLNAAGVEDYNHLEFTHCRSYSVESSILFDPEPQEPAQRAPSNSPPIPSSMDASRAVPALLLITVELTTSISDRDTVGTLIEGKVSTDVLRKGKIVIPRGSVVRGRIRRLERYQEGSGTFIVGLEFTELEVRGGLPFYADVLRIDKNLRIQLTRSETVFVHDSAGTETREETVTLPELPGVASFFVSGNTFTLPSGFRTVWRTRGPIR